MFSWDTQTPKALLFFSPFPCSWSLLIVQCPHTTVGNCFAFDFSLWAVLVQSQRDCLMPVAPHIGSTGQWLVIKPWLHITNYVCVLTNACSAYQHTRIPGKSPLHTGTWGWWVCLWPNLPFQSKMQVSLQWQTRGLDLSLLSLQWTGGITLYHDLETHRASEWEQLSQESELWSFSDRSPPECSLFVLF